MLADGDHNGLDVKPCWRSIGVYGGDHSCSRLEEAIHCRNCPVFGDAARTLFDRPSGIEEDLQETVVQRTTPETSALLFRLGSEWLALRTSRLAEVTIDLPVRRIAHRTGGRLEGVINVRGELRMCIALIEALHLGQRALQSSLESRMILLVDGESGAVAFRADAVAGLQRFAVDAIEPMPDNLPDGLRQCAEGMVMLGGRHVLLLREDALAATLAAAIAS